MKKLLHSLGLDGLLPPSFQVYSPFTSSSSTSSTGRSKSPSHPSRPGTPSSVRSSRRHSSRSRSRSRSSTPVPTSATPTTTTHNLKDQTTNASSRKPQTIPEATAISSEKPTAATTTAASNLDWDYPLSPFTQQQSSPRPVPFREHSSSSVITIKTPTPGSPRSKHTISTNSIALATTTAASTTASAQIRPTPQKVPEITISPVRPLGITVPPSESEIVRYRHQEAITLPRELWNHSGIFGKIAKRRRGVTTIRIEVSWGVIFEDQSDSVSEQEEVKRILLKAERFGLGVLLALENPTQDTDLKKDNVTRFWRDVQEMNVSGFMVGLEIAPPPSDGSTTKTKHSFLGSVVSKLVTAQEYDNSIPLYISTTQQDVEYLAKWASAQVEEHKQSSNSEKQLHLVLSIQCKDGTQPEEIGAMLKSKKVDYVVVTANGQSSNTTPQKPKSIFSPPPSGYIHMVTADELVSEAPILAPTQSTMATLSRNTPPPSRALALSKKSALKRGAVDTYSRSLIPGYNNDNSNSSSSVSVASKHPSLPLPALLQQRRNRSRSPSPSPSPTPSLSNGHSATAAAAERRSKSLTRNPQAHSHSHSLSGGLRKFGHERGRSEGGGGGIVAGKEGREGRDHGNGNGMVELGKEERKMATAFEEGFDVAYMDSLGFMFPQRIGGGGGSRGGSSVSVGYGFGFGFGAMEAGLGDVGSVDDDDGEGPVVVIEGRIGFVEGWIGRRVADVEGAGVVEGDGGGGAGALLAGPFEEGMRTGLAAFRKAVSGV